MPELWRKPKHVLLRKQSGKYLPQPGCGLSVRKTASYKQIGANFCLIPGHGVGARGAVTLRPSNEV